MTRILGFLGFGIRTVEASLLEVIKDSSVRLLTKICSRRLVNSPRRCGFAKNGSGRYSVEGCFCDESAVEYRSLRYGDGWLRVRC